MSEEQRAPLLSDEGVEAIRSKVRKDYKSEWQNGYYVRDWYEAKITSGELMVVKTVSRSQFVDASQRYLRHEFCQGPGDGWVSKREFNKGATSFCPGCGARIEKP